MRFRFCVLSAVALVVSFPAFAANITFGALDAQQGLSFSKDVQAQYGYITSLTVGTTAVAPDIVVKTPAGGTMNVVGVLNSFAWNGGYADPFAINVSVSANTARLLDLWVRGTNKNANFALVVNDFDPMAKAYFVAFTQTADSTPLKGILMNGSLAKAAGPTPFYATYAFSLTPAPVQQNVVFATAVNMVIAKKWGVTVSP